MKYTIDGDHVCITRDDFVNLQESPALFYPIYSDIAKILLKDGIIGLSVGDLRVLQMRLSQQITDTYKIMYD